jgi:geranylgeranyl pyrophosphate synthase
MDLIENATSVGIAGAFELGCLIGGGTERQRKKFRDFGLYLGHLLQIRDDLIDYVYDESLIKKGAFNDLFSKKRRLPLLVAYWEGTNRDKNQIEEILKKNKIELEDALVIIDMITNQKIEKRIKGIAASIAVRAKRELSLLPNTPPAKDILLEIVELFTDL